MRLTAQQEYGLRCMMQMARTEPGLAVRIADIAEREALSIPYVAKLMRILRQAELVTSIRGVKGGYVLAKPAKTISAAEIYSALGDELFDAAYCKKHSGQADDCIHVMNCGGRGMLKGLHQLVQDYLERFMLADLVESEEQVAQAATQHIHQLSKRA